MVYYGFNPGGLDMDPSMYSGGMNSGYMGQPVAQYPSYGIAAGPYMTRNPNDAFVQHEEVGEEHKGSSGWKKYLAGGLIGAVGVLGLSKIKPEWFGEIGGKISLNSSKKEKEKAEKLAKEKKKMKEEILDEIKETKKGKKKVTAEEATKFSEKIKNLPTWGKVAAGVAIGLAAIFGVSKVLGKNKPEKTSDTEAELEKTKESNKQQH